MHRTPDEWADYWQAECFAQWRKRGWTLFFLTLSVILNIILLWPR